MAELEKRHLIAEDEEPKDRFHLVYLVFFLLGLAMLMPWNFFATAVKYFTLKLQYKNSTHNGSIDLGTNDPREKEDLFLSRIFENTLTVSTMLPSVLFMFINTYLTKRTPINARVYIGMAGTFFVFLLTAILVKVNVEEWQETFFVVTIISVILLNSLCALIQGSVIGAAAVFPPHYMGAILNGQAVAGLFAAVVNIISLALATSPIDYALPYFLTALVIVFISALAYFYLSFNRFSAYYMKRTGNKKRSISESGMQKTTSINGKDGDASTISNSSIIGVFKQVWILCLSLLVTFMTTLSLFPSITSKVISVSTEANDWTVLYFIPVGCFVLYNVGDLIGRLSVQYSLMYCLKRFITVEYRGRRVRTQLLFLLLSCLRIVLVPLIMLCKFDSRPGTYSSDVPYFIFILLLGFSNGLCAALCMIFGPTFVPTRCNEMAGVILSFFISFGLAVGASLSYALLLLI